MVPLYLTLWTDVSRDTCDELSTPATANPRCAISVGVGRHKAPNNLQCLGTSHSRLALTGLAQRAMDPQGADPAHAFTPSAKTASEKLEAGR